jgi:transposase
MALNRADGIEFAVLNPKLVHRFAQTLRRSKTDSAQNPNDQKQKEVTEDGENDR